MNDWHLDQRFDTSGGSVAAGSAGDGPALVLAHGWPWSSYAWHRVIPTLAQHFTVYWFDMPGFGQSEMSPPEPPSLALQGHVFGEMLDHWQLDKPAVLAHDFGGAVSLRAHLLHGRDLSQLVLMNVVAMRPWGSAFFDHVGQHIEAFQGVPPHIHRGIADAYIAGALARPIPDQDRERLLEPWLSAEGQSAFYTQFALAEEALTAEFEPLLSKMRCPVSVLWGEDDPWIPLARGEALAGALCVSLHRLSGLGHLPQLENPSLVTDAVLRTLAPQPQMVNDV
ncbi:MAG: alpha/beta hydrolase [Pseudomonadota bacterium]